MKSIRKTYGQRNWQENMGRGTKIWDGVGKYGNWHENMAGGR